MNDKAWKAVAKDIYFKREALDNERKALNDEISSVRTAVREGLVDDKVKKKELQDKYREELHKEGYRKTLNGKLKDLKTMENDLMSETGNFDATQLSLFEVDTIRDEFENDDNKVEGDSNDFDDFEKEGKEEPKEATKKGKKK